LSVTIRSTEPADQPEVLEVVYRAFTSDDYEGTAEVDIVTSTWARSVDLSGLDLVAVDDGRVIGHVIAAVGDLAQTPAIGIAPLSVTPARQGQGVGSALMLELLSRIDAAGWPLSLLLGEPAYYERFGFETASNHGIHYPPVGQNPAFQVRLQDSNTPIPSGDFVYCFERP
jgi:putative acetyltransferase